MIKLLILLPLIILGFLVWTIKNNYLPKGQPVPAIPKVNLPSVPLPSPKPTLVAPPSSKVLPNNYHIFQSFNNCGPAALSMALSYYGINVSQQQLGQDLRPYQVPGGDNDDKSVTLEELAEKSKDYGFTPYHRPGGNIDIIKMFIAYDIPVIARTWLRANDDIGHYRIIKGYDQTTSEIIQDDSLQGKNLRYSYPEFDAIWKKFNYEYLVLVPKDKEYIVKSILNQNADAEKSWSLAAQNARKELEKDSNDIAARFNLSVALYNTGDYQKSIEEFEKVENLLPFRTLWYQIEPIQAYYQLGRFDKVFSITDKVLAYHNRAFSELYLLRGEIYKKQGQPQLARSEFQKAVLYNQNLKAAQDALNSLN
ncbi:MAG: C39 family peptidase [Candidatus Curtissbacteria bacterium]